MLTIENTALVVIDIQGKLAQIAYEQEALLHNTKNLIKGAKVLELPIIYTEQYPKGLGPTAPEIKELLEDLAPIEKLYFSCCGEQNFMKALVATGCKQILLCGIETHVCVYQTARDLLDLGYEVEVLADCVSSRTVKNREIGLNKMHDAGAAISCVETALFELLVLSKGDKFKAISKIVK